MKPRIRAYSNQYDEWLYFYAAWDAGPSQLTKDLLDLLVITDKKGDL